MLVVIMIVVVVFAIAVVVNLILHPVQTLRKLARFVTAFIAVCLVVGSVVVFIMPKTSLVDWIGPVLLALAGVSFAVLYNFLAPARRA